MKPKQSRMAARLPVLVAVLLVLCAHSVRPVAAWVNNWDGPLDFNCGSGGVYYFQVSCEQPGWGELKKKSSHDM